jgi:hypothetical protein
MKSVTLKALKEELENITPKELMEICLRLAKFKKENKELMTYILFESSDEIQFIMDIKSDIDQQFEMINRKSFYLIKKSVRKILKDIKKYSRYTPKKETEIDLLIYFCNKLKHFKPSISKSPRLQNLYTGQLELIRKKIALLHEDLQYDYGVELERLSVN